MKARFLALAALVLGMASCQNDFDGASVGVGGEVDFQLKVSAVELATRAGNTDRAGKDSAYGAIDYFEAAGWDGMKLRYTMEVYDVDEQGNVVTTGPVKDRMTQVVDDYQPVSFDLRLVPGRDYRFVVFADFVNAAGEGLHHDITDLKAIKIKNDGINDECTDAYFDVLDVLDLQNNQTGEMVLTRPYGKVRVIATDLAELNLNVDPGQVEVAYTAKHPQTFNAVLGVIDEYTAEDYVFTYEYEDTVGKTSLADHLYTLDYDAMVEDGRHTHMTLFTDYILAKDTQESIHFTMTVYDQAGDPIKTTNFNTEIPVQRNYLTTVIGNVLTTATEINVTIDDSFKSPDYEVELWDGKTVTPVDEKDGVYEIYEAAELAWIAQAVAGGETFIGKTVKLYKDINLNGERWTPIGLSSQHSSTFRGTFDGNGKAIENLFVDNEQGAGLFGMASPKAIRNLTIKNATIKGTHYAGALAGWIQSVDSQSHNRGVIEGCRVEGANVTLAVANKDNGDKAGALVGYAVRVDITGCEVNNAEVKAYRDVAGLVGHANTTTTVSNNTVKNVIVVADQTAEYIEVKAANAGAVVGRVSTDATIENNTVENVDVRVVVNTAANLQSMIANAEDDKEATIVLGGDINLNDLVTRAAGNNLVIANGKSVVLDLNGYTLSAIDENTSGNFYLIDNRGNLTIKDSKGEGKIALSATTNRNWNASSVVVANNPGGNLVVESGIIEHLGGTDMAYAVDNLTNGKGTYAVTTIEKATIKSTYRAVRQFLNGVEATNELYVKAGAVIDGTNNKSIFFHDPSKNANTGKLVVEQGAQLKGDVYLFVTAGSTEWPVEVSIAASALQGESKVTLGNVPAGYAVVEKAGNYVVEKGFEVNGNEVAISSAAGLEWVAAEVNNRNNYFEGKNVVLTADIDLAGYNWTPIGSATQDHGFMGNFNGNGYTIKNLNIDEIARDSDGYAYAGLFGVTEGVDENNQNTIKNLTIENVTISTEGHIVAAAIAYPYYTVVENVTVKGDIQIVGGDYVAGVLGYTRRCVNAKNLVVEANANSSITGDSTIGGVLSDLQMNGGLKADYSDFKVSGLTINANTCVGGISGIISGQTLNGATVENVTICCSDVRKGQIAGAVGEESFITEANVKNVTGAENLVGATYDSGKTGKVTINGAVYEYLADGTITMNGALVVADGVVIDAEGAYCISNKAGMFWFANEVNVNKNAFKGKTVKLAADIDLNNAAWTPIGQTGVKTFDGVFDGQNKTIYNLNVNSIAQTGANYSSGLFGWVETHSEGNGILKNVKIENAVVKGNHNCGALVGYITEKFAIVDNCHVSNAAIECHVANSDANGDKAGALIGNATNATKVNNCSAANSTVSAGRDAGQLIGVAKLDNVTNCSATNVSVSANGEGTGANINNEVVGRKL